jgi:hypothetical protein
MHETLTMVLVTAASWLTILMVVAATPSEPTFRK